MENTGNKAATLTVSEKIMSVCRKAIQWTCVFDLVLALSGKIFINSQIQIACAIVSLNELIELGFD